MFRFISTYNGLLKVFIDSSYFYDISKTHYYIIYSLDAWEECDEDLNPLKKTTDKNNVDKNVSKNNKVSGIRSLILYDNNNYNYSWLDIRLTDYELDYTSNDSNLFAEFVLKFKESSGNVLKDVQTYITTNKGIKIDSDGYLTRDGEIPNNIDIWMDGLEHKVFLGPTFPIVENDNVIQDGIKLTLSFIDLKQSYYVRKTYEMKDNEWFYEELFAFPLKEY